jgi:hypothetical protein
MEPAFGPTSSAYSERDLLKIEECASRGISLIVIPFWYASLIPCSVVVAYPLGGMAMKIVYQQHCIEHDLMCFLSLLQVLFRVKCQRMH